MKTEPLSHQRAGYDLSREMEYFGVWWEQGTGKSKLIVDCSCDLFLQEKITALLVVAPNHIHGNWITQEFPAHCWEEVEWSGLIYSSGCLNLRKTEEILDDIMIPSIARMAVLVMNYEALRTDDGFDLAKKFLKAHRVMMVLDESTAIADPNSATSKSCHLLGPLAAYRRVMSGTPVVEGPFKIYSPMKFLSPTYWKKYGLDTFSSFRNTFAVYKTGYARGRQFQELDHYRNLDYLQELIAKHSQRVLKDDVLDLPPKIYNRVEFDLTPSQRKLYDQVKEELVIQLDAEHEINAATALVKLTRLQQIASGYAVTNEIPPISTGDIVVYSGENYVLNGEIEEISDDRVRIVGARDNGDGTPEELWVQHDDPRCFRLVAAQQKIVDIVSPSENPRLKAMNAILDQAQGKAIIWARFTRDLDIICNHLGDQAVRFDGTVKHRDRPIALDRFRRDRVVRYFVANPQAISMGVTLNEGETTVYYSNSFFLILRLQSEDRNHRFGQKKKVNVFDLQARDTVDGHIIKTLRDKKSLSETILGDRVRSWIA